jgi:hypothetical protein
VICSLVPLMKCEKPLLPESAVQASTRLYKRSVCFVAQAFIQKRRASELTVAQGSIRSNKGSESTALINALYALTVQ